MIPRTPEFWYKKPGPAALALSPLAALYHIGHKIHQSVASPKKAPFPVICVGNITVGGSGKTPTALALMELIKAHKLALKPHFLTRGYGGSETGPAPVDLKKHTARHVGDESLLLARTAPTLVSADRYQGALLAAEKGADMILMDDGLQNTDIIKDFSFIVIDGATGFGNHLMIPAGPLRQPLSEGLSRAGAFIIIGEDRHNASALLPSGKPVLHAQIIVDPEKIPAKDIPYIGFAGLGRPEKFKATLESLDLDLRGFHPFPDHHPYAVEDLQPAFREAQSAGAQLITTEKDFLRLPETFKPYVTTLPVSLKFEDPNTAVSILSGVLK